MTALDQLAQAGPPTHYRVIDGNLISRWEQARVQRGRRWKPTKSYVLYLLRLFADHLDRTSAHQWTIDAGYKLTARELQELFPTSNPSVVQASDETSSLATPGVPTATTTDGAPVTKTSKAKLAADPTRAQIVPIHATSEMPVVTHFHGRTAEVTALVQWLRMAPDGGPAAPVRLVAVVGMGGIGKTALTAHSVTRVAEEFPEEFPFVLWRSLLNAPPLAEILRDWLQILSRQTLVTLPETEAAQLQLLLHYLRQERCLLVLDNLESILQAGEAAGQMRPGYEAYEQLLQAVGSRVHGSCLLVTSREQPHVLDGLLRNTPTTRVLPLHGLDPQAGAALLQAQGLTLLPYQVNTLVEHYSGNPLALCIVASTIADWFAGDVAAFQQDGAPVFSDIRAVLDQQFARLSDLERDLLLWLAIEREAITAPRLRENLLQKRSSRLLLEALQALKRRSLLLQQGDGFTLQNVVIEYTTEYLVEQVYQEIYDLRLSIADSREAVPDAAFGNQPSTIINSFLNRFALLKAQAKEYVRQSQERLIVQPIVERMVAHVGQQELINAIQRLLARLRAGLTAHKQGAPGYAGGNLLNLLRYLNVDLTGYDFSRLAVWQAYLQGVDLPAVNFTQADLRDSVFTKNFGLCRVLAFAPDGTLLAGGMTNGEIHLWQPDDGQPLAMLKVHETRIWDLAFSPDGQWLVSGSKDQTVRLTERITGRCLQIFAGHTDWVRSVAVHPNGQFIASGSQDQTVRLWDVQTGRTVHILPHQGWVLDLAFSPDGVYLASVGTDHTLYLWHVATGQRIATGHGHQAAIYTVSFSSDGILLATGSDDRTLRLWEVAALVNGEKYSCRTVLTGHSAGIYVATFSPDGQRLISGGAEAAIRIWEVATGQPLHTLVGHQREVNTLAISPNGMVLATGESDTSMIYLWELTPSPVRHARLGYRNWTNAIAFHPHLPLLAGANADGKVDLWHAATGRHRQTLRGVKQMSRALAFGGRPDQAVVHLAVGSTDRTVRLWSVAVQEHSPTGIQTSGEPVQVWQTPGEVHAVAFSADHQQIFAGGYDGAVHSWDVATGQPRQTFHLQGDPRIKSIAVSPDGQYLAAGSHNFTIALWQRTTGALRPIQGHTAWIWTLAFHPASWILASGSFDRTVCLWEVDTGHLLHRLPHPASLVQVIAFSPNGNYLAVGMGDATIYLWATHDLAQTPSARPTLVAQWQEHADLIQSLAFGRDSLLLASTSLDGTIKVWEVERRRCLHTLHAPGPYTGMNITGVTGITEAQKQALMALGAALDGT
ncbi:MAG: NB-ARC domain-containing protein [Caldilineaceae bacterium]